jgi:trimeric autotransporter adhesin
MIRKVYAGIALMLLSLTGTAQTVTPVPVTGFTADVIANGPTFAGSVTADVDSGSYYFLNQSFTAFGTPTNYLPNSGSFVSAASALVSFQMADASVNNSLRLDTIGETGTLTFVTPRTAAIVYLLATSGGSAATINVTLNFTDGTTQLVTGINVPDWYGGTSFAIQGIGRVNGIGQVLDNGGGTINPRIYQVAVPVNGPNYTKLISSVTFTRVSSRGITQIMAVSAMNACAPPAAQPTSLVLTAASTSQITGTFTASSPTANAYLVVRHPAGATPVNPVNGTTYTVGSTLGTGTVIQINSSTSFSAAGLTGGTAYDFYVYGYNNTGCIGPVYNTTAPLTATHTTNTCTGPSGVIPVGPTGTYPTLTAALNALQGGVSGSVILELQSAYTSAGETFPIVIATNACLNATRTLTIRPEAGANGLVITSSGVGPTIDFSGANYVTIDGRPGGTGSAIAVTAAGTTNSTNLNIINTNTAGAAIRLDYGASNNTIKYCDLQGLNATAASQPTGIAGVVYIGNNGVNGNDSNNFDHCNIHSTGAGSAKPTIGIYSLGYDNSSAVASYVPQFNDRNAVIGCNIYDYFNAGNAVGLEVNLGNTGWTIAANSFFQTEAISVTTSNAFNRAIWIAPFRTSSAGEVGNGFIIISNFIGGSAPNCGGTPYTMASGSAGFFEGIRLEVADAATPQASTSVQGNVITNFTINTSTATTTTDAFHAIAVVNGKGNVEVGNNTGNIIGAATGVNGSTDGGITINATGSIASHMIYLTGTYNATIKNNAIGNVLLTAAGNSFSGIFTNAAITGNFSNNTIANITASSNGTTTGRFVNGIQVTTAAAVLTIANNIIKNLTSNYATTGTALSQVVGINITSTTANISGGITNNTIANLVNATQSTATAGSSAIIGIANASTNAAGYVIAGNIIDSLVATTSTVAAVNITGLYCSGTTSVNNTIAKNFIHSFDANAANTGAVFNGIYVGGGTSVYSNNMVRLGIKPNGASLTTALSINGIVVNATANNSFYHNSVYIGGTGVGANAANSYAFTRITTSGTHDIRNNIFANTRSNATGGGKHFSISFAGSNAGTTVKYNVYQYSGTGGRFAYSGTTEVGNYLNGGTPTAGWLTGDVNSVTGEPNFIDPTGNLSAVNLHINAIGTSVAEGTGTAIASITDDYDGDTRSGLTPVDIGADAGNFVAPPAACTTPDAPTGLVLTTISANQIDGSFTASLGGANGYLIVRYPAGATPVTPVDGITYQLGSMLGAGTVVATGSALNFNSAGLLASTTYDYYVYAYNNACISAVKYSTGITASKATSGCSGPSGLITVGPGANFPTLTAALASLNGGISGPVIVELQSNYVSTGETWPITIGSNACLSPVNTVLIRPAANANGLVIGCPYPVPAIDFSGGTYVTIDGRPGGVGSAIGVTAAGSLNTTNLNIINTSAIGTAIRFDNQASFNYVKYCDLQGMNAVGGSQPIQMAGVVYFGNNGANGNDNNTIDHCNIHSSGTGADIPSIGVYSLGANNTGANSNFNDNDTISNCNIYDYFLVNNNSAGIELTQGASGWVITRNSFFQTTTRTYTTAGFNRGIWISTNRNVGSIGNGFTITDNYIGGSAPAAAGTAYTLTALANFFDGIRLEVADGFPVVPSSVQGNTITNISITSTVTTANDVFHGIAVTNSNGNVNIGTVTGNIVGSAAGNGAITISGGSGSHTIPYFISNGGGANSVINLKQNIAGGITLSNAGNNFSGIFDNQVGTVNIDGNLIGSLTTANSINAVNTSTTNIYVRGINIPSGAGAFAITNNTIANLTNNAGGSGNTCQTAGINIGSSASVVTTVSNNTVRNLYSASAYAFGSGSSAVLGIYMGASTANPVTVTGNTVHSLVSGAATAAVYIEGIFFWGNNSTAVTNTVSRNKVHSFDVTTANTNANMRGIEINQGKVNVYNNMVRLGIRADGSSITNAIRIDGILKGSGLNCSVLYNSVYIGGTGIGTTVKNTSAFRKETTTGADDVRNNIFINNRSNATATGGTHYALWFDNQLNFTIEHNIYGYGGTGGKFVSTNGTTGTPFAATYTSKWILGADSTSLVVDPLFVDATGSAATVDLHLINSAASPANAAGVPVALVTDDIEGEARDLLTPDVGADEFTQSNSIDMQAVSLETPIAGKGCYGKEVVTIKVRNNSSVDMDFVATPMTITVNVTGAATANIISTVNTGSLAAGGTMDVKLAGITDTVDMRATGTYIFAAKTTVAGDVKVSNDAMAIVTRTKVALVTGTINASQTSYCFNGAPVLTASGGNGFSDIQWQQSTDSATYTNITNATTTPFATTAATQTLYYRLAAGCVSDTLYTPAVKVVISSPAITATTPASRCNTGLVNLQATGTPGATLYWYSDAISTTPIGIGAGFTTPSINDTTTYYVMAVEGSCQSARTAVVATVNDRIAIATQPQGQGVCMGSAVTFTINATGSALTYQWRKDGVNITSATNATYSIANAVAADAGQYDVVITNPCGIVVSNVAGLSVQSSNNWVGQVSSDWNTAANWCGGVPVSTTNVSINAGTPYSPVISGTANANTVTIGTGAALAINASGTLNLYGNFINRGTLNATSGTVAFRGTTNQNIASMAVGNAIMNGAGGVTLNGNLTVGNTLTLTSGNITLGSFDLYLQNATTGSVASHIITNGTGSAIATNVTNTITVPVGHSAGVYNPVTIGNGQGMSYTVRVKEGLIAKVIDDSKAINRTWNVTTTSVPANAVNITLQYADVDANPGCVPTAVMDAGAYNGATWALISPTGGVTPTGTSVARLVSLSTTLLGNIVITNQGMLKQAVHEFNVQLLPTLVTGSSARLRISSSRTMKISWTILDAAGKTVKRFTTSSIPGMNDVDVNMATLASGVYTLHGVGDDSKIQTIRFMIKH